MASKKKTVSWLFTDHNLLFFLGSDLVFLWSELHHRLQTPKTDLLKEIHQLMLSATNVNSIFPFIRAILQEVRDTSEEAPDVAKIAALSGLDCVMRPSLLRLRPGG